MNNKDIKKRIRECRAKLGLSRAELAEKLGVTVPTVFYWESDDPARHGPNGDNLLRLAKVLEVSTDYLMYGVMTNDLLTFSLGDVPFPVKKIPFLRWHEISKWYKMRKPIKRRFFIMTFDIQMDNDGGLMVIKVDDNISLSDKDLAPVMKGDKIYFDLHKKAANDSLVIARIGKKFLPRRFIQTKEGRFLKAHDTSLPLIRIPDDEFDDSMEVLGVIVRIERDILPNIPR